MAKQPELNSQTALKILKKLKFARSLWPFCLCLLLSLGAIIGIVNTIPLNDNTRLIEAISPNVSVLLFLGLAVLVVLSFKQWIVFSGRYRLYQYLLSTSLESAWILQDKKTSQKVLFSPPTLKEFKLLYFMTPVEFDQQGHSFQFNVQHILSRLIGGFIFDCRFTLKYEATDRRGFLRDQIFTGKNKITQGNITAFVESLLASQFPKSEFINVAEARNYFFDISSVAEALFEFPDLKLTHFSVTLEFEPLEIWNLIDSSKTQKHTEA